MSAVNNLKIGTCSWNYPSWVGLIYSSKQRYAADYLHEYSQKYRTVEIDSWFYNLPDEETVDSYLAQVDKDFTFSCKVISTITYTYLRLGNPKELILNPDFLSAKAFNDYLARIKHMLPQIDSINLEFEYMNRSKMPGLDVFMAKLDRFLGEIPSDIPLVIETRNNNYLHKEYFQFLKEKGVGHVFSEKMFMPPLYEVYEKISAELTNHSVIRLLGGDRRAIEAKTKKQWHQIVDEKEDLHRIADMIRDMIRREMVVQVYMNNHYEGCAPKSIERLEKMLGGGIYNRNKL